MSSGIVEPSSTQKQQQETQSEQDKQGPVRSKLVQRLLDASPSLPAFMKDLLNTQAVVVAGTEACAFLVERQGENMGLRLLHHLRPDESDAETRAQAVKAFQGIIQPCVVQRKDGAIEVGSPDGGDMQYCLVTVLRNEGEVVAASAVITRCRDMERAKQRLTSMQLVAGYFELFSLRRYVESARTISDRHQQVLQYAGAVSTAEGFESSAMNLCNELANRTGATRVALGWRKGRNIRVRALSHTEKFDKKQDLVVSLERVMEESHDQEEPVRFDPEGTSSQNVTREANRHSIAQGNNSVISLPLRRRDEIVGILTLEFPPRFRLDEGIEAGLGVAAELLTPQLFDRHENDRYLFVKVGHAFRDWTKLAIGPKHMGVKLLILAVLAAAMLLVLIKPVYHVKPGFVLNPAEKRAISAPWDGEILLVRKRPGETVQKDEVIAEMRTTEMDIKRIGLEAEARTKALEADKARSEGKPAEEKIAMAARDQALAQAKLLAIQISQAQLKAPFDGVLQKGDLYDRLGAPARQGDILFEIAKSAAGKPDTMDVEAELHVSERDIQEVKWAFAQGRKIDGRLATTSFPSMDVEFKITRIVPDGQPKDGENVFKVYAQVIKPEPWMHPGLAGEARVEIREHTLFWIWTHRLGDWLRLKAWKIGATGI